MNKLNDHRVMLCLVAISVALYLWMRMDHGWIPHDEGLLGQSAERVLNGEIPHIDFDDPYTGGQAMLHAMAFKIFGISSHSIRIVLLIFSLLAAITIYSLSSRLASPWLSGLITWTCVAWSMPNYFAGLPSWYNLFFALFGTWALVKFDETTKPRWLILAGMMGGISFLFKLSGIFFIAGGLLYLVYREQDTLEKASSARKDRLLFLLFSTISLSSFIALLVVLIRQRLTPMDTILFVLPGTLLSLFLMINEWQKGSGNSLERFKRLLNPISLFLVGAAVPVLFFLIPYGIHSGINELVQGVFVLPQKRIKWADYPLPPIGSLLSLIPLAVLFFIPIWSKFRIDSLWITLVAALCGVVGILLGASDAIYQQMWNTTRLLIPLATIVGIATMLMNKAGHDDTLPNQRRLILLLLSMAAMVSLVQFPYSFGIYFCYAAPFAVLALVAVTKHQTSAPQRVHVCILCLYLGFALFWLNQGRVQQIGVQYVPQNNDTLLDLPRSGLWMSESQANLYQEVIDEVSAHSEPGDTIYATSDCPEIYFLAGRKNPTRTFYDFFEPDFEAEPQQRIAKIAKMLEQSKVDVIVLHWQGEFSGTLSFELAGALAESYPNVKHFVRKQLFQSDDQPVFSVAWRDRTPQP